MVDRFNRRAVLSVLSALPLTALAAPRAGWATIKGNQNQDQERDGHSRHEDPELTYVPITTGSGSYRINRLVFIQTRFVYVADTSLGVDYESLDKVDMSDVPLLGDIFNRAVGPEDFTEQNRIGAVFQAGNNSLAAVIDDDIDLANMMVQIVNGNGIRTIKMEPRIVEVAPTDLGEFGSLETVRTLVSGRATDGMTLVIAGLRPDRVADVDDDKVPFLGDIPVLKNLFRGSAHEGEKRELRILITPSIIMGDDGET